MTTTTENGRFRRSTVSVVLLDKLGAALARNWWLIALRGVLGVTFGVIALGSCRSLRYWRSSCCFRPT
jgi:hypothetical protein